MRLSRLSIKRTTSVRRGHFQQVIVNRALIITLAAIVTLSAVFSTKQAQDSLRTTQESALDANILMRDGQKRAVDWILSSPTPRDAVERARQVGAEALPHTFSPGSLHLSTAETLQYCYTNTSVYRNHFNGGNSFTVAVSHPYKLAYILLPKSGSSTGRYVMNKLFAAKEDLWSFPDRDGRPKGNMIRYKTITFVRDPLSRFFAQYEEALARSIGDEGTRLKVSRKYPFLFDDIHTYEDYEDLYCPEHTRTSRRDCALRPSQENGTLTERFERFVESYDGVSPFNVHLRLQVPLLSTYHSGRAIPVMEIYNSNNASIEWSNLAAAMGIDLPPAKVMKARAFPRRLNLHLVSNRTRRRICNLALLDYCCLNIPLPPPCSEDQAMLKCRLDYDGPKKQLRIQPAVFPGQSNKMSPAGRLHGMAKNDRSEKILTLKSHGFGVDLLKISRALLDAVSTGQGLRVKFTGKGWLYSQGVCLDADLSCFFVRPDLSTHTPTTLDEALRLLLVPRDELKNELGNGFSSPQSCGVIHVRHADTVLNFSWNRSTTPIYKYLNLSEYVDAFRRVADEITDIVLLTDDQNVIDDVYRYKSTDLRFHYLDRHRFRGAEGGWENHFPSGNRSEEVINILKIQKLISNCSVWVGTQSSFATVLQGLMHQKPRFITLDNRLPKTMKLPTPKCNHSGKVFCIGMMKTGTTSCGSLLNELGYSCSGETCGFVPLYPKTLWDYSESAKRYTIEMLKGYQNGKLWRALNTTLSANDGPWNFMFEALRDTFPGSRFIYTTRNLHDMINSDTVHFWTKGVKNFDDIIATKEKKLGLDPVAAQMAFLRRYNQHKKRVKEVFSDAKDDILTIDFSNTLRDTRKDVEEFLGCPISGLPFPRENSKKREYFISDKYWEFLNSYEEYNFSGITKGIGPTHVKSGKSAHSIWTSFGQSATRSMIEAQPLTLPPPSVESFPIETYGYPSTKIGIGDLNLCDIGWAGMPRHAQGWPPLSCVINGTHDPSCMACLKPESIQAADVIWSVYSKGAESRRHALGNLFIGNSIVVILCNEQYLDMAKLWWKCSSTNGLDRRSTLVFALDEDSKLWAESQSIGVVTPSVYSISVPEKLSSAFKYALLPLFLDLMHMGRHVLFNDVDILWTANLQQNLHSLWPDIPLVSQLAPRWDAQGTLNSGILSIRPTKQMICFVETLMSTLPIFIESMQGPSDQVMWNHLLRHHKFRTLPWRTLSTYVIVNAGFDKNLLSLTNLTWAIHWVGGNYRKKLDSMKNFLHS